MFAVLRHNPRFRRLWTAQVVSQLGDWFNRVAVVTLIGSLAGPNALFGFGLMLGINRTVSDMFYPLMNFFQSVSGACSSVTWKPKSSKRQVGR